MKLIKEEKDILTEDTLDQCRNDANSICRYIDKNGMGVWYDLIDYDMYPMNTSKVSFQVEGDWKHDHARFKNLVYDWAEENGRDIFKIDSIDLDDGDSDNYTARYDVFITADKDSFDKLNSMRGLFAEGLNNKEKQIYIDSVNEAEDIDDLKEIVHEIYWYDKALFVKINKFPPDRDFEEIKANILKNLGAVDESLTDGCSLNEVKMWGRNYRYDIVWYNKEGKRINFGFTNDINDAENIAIRACKHIYGMSPSNDRVQFLDSLDIEDTENKNISAITSKVVDVKKKFLSKLENKNESLDESRALNYVVEPHKIDMGVYDIVFCNDHPHAGERAHSKRFTSYDDALNFIKRNAKYNNWDASPMNEDTVKTKDGKWTNKGKEGTHGKFDTKKEADAQRKAMFASGYHEDYERPGYEGMYLVCWDDILGDYHEAKVKANYPQDAIDKVRKRKNVDNIFDCREIDMFISPARIRKAEVVESLKESYYKLCWYDSDPETGIYGDKFDCYAVVKAFDAKDAQEKFKDLILRTGDEQDRDRIRYFKNFTDYLRDSQMYIDDATEDEYNEYKDYQDTRFESLKEDFSDFNLINYNDFLANNFDGWSDDIDYLIKDLNKVAKALGTSAQKLVFYIDYDEDFWAADDIADVTLYLAHDYSIYKSKSSDIKFALVPDNVWIFKNEEEANSVINDVKAFVNDMDESLSRWGRFSEGLIDITDDFRFARENWKKLVPDVDFDIALERWNKESKLAEPVHWYAKPLYSSKAWDDMVQMFQKTDIPEIEEPDIEDSDESDMSFNDDFDAEPEE